jgi:N6-L-threonylcarbamoyladenine synthase
VSERNIYILGIESSCDDTSAAVLKGSTVLSNVIAGQAVHQRYGGVVPELASRSHQANIIPVVHEALTQAKITKNELSAIAFTRGPGLLGSLLVGTSFAKGLAQSLEIPLIDVHHMQAHILAHFIEGSNVAETGKHVPPTFPFLCLTVSGGHTQLVKVSSPFDFTIVGETIDDAAGEAFDKTAKMLGLPYPGGPLIDKYASKGNPLAFTFPTPSQKGLNFSFSGLKTSVLYFLQDKVKTHPEFIQDHLEDLCASIQHTIVDALIHQLKKASKELNIQAIAIAGGVSANSYLRYRLMEEAGKEKWKVFIPHISYCTDNAAMIAMAGHFKYIEKDFASLDISADARMID